MRAAIDCHVMTPQLPRHDLPLPRHDLQAQLIRSWSWICLLFDEPLVFPSRFVDSLVKHQHHQHLPHPIPTAKVATG